MMSILVVDHYDSFTYNLQLIEGLGTGDRRREVGRGAGRGAGRARTGGRRPVAGTGASPRRRAASPTSSGCFRRHADPRRLPGTPGAGIAEAGTVDRTTPVHGKASLVHHEGRILDGVASPFEAGRYHPRRAPRLVARRSGPHGVDRGRPRWRRSTASSPASACSSTRSRSSRRRGRGSSRTSSPSRAERRGQPGPYQNAPELGETLQARTSTATNASAGTA